MKVIFLDIDGVLNTDKSIIEQIEKEGKKLHYHFDSIAMENLKEIVNRFDCKLVISSTWRLSYDGLSLLQKELKEYGIDDAIIGGTPVYHDAKRGVEIQTWLDDNEHDNYRHVDIDDFIIIDDDDDMEHLMPHLIKTNCFDGLNDVIKNKIIQRFDTK